MEGIVDIQLGRLARTLSRRGLRLAWTPEARRWLAERGYDPAFGARPMARLIQNEIKRVLADEILFGKLQNGGKVEVDEDEGKLKFNYETAAVQ